MEIEFKRAKRMRIEEFADKHDLKMEIGERQQYLCGNDEMRFWARFKGVEAKDYESSCILSGEHGNGRTPEAAINNYATKITGKLLVVDAKTDGERKIWVDCDLLPTALELTQTRREK